MVSRPPGGRFQPPVMGPDPNRDIPGIVDRGGVVKTNRTNQGVWGNYLNALRKGPSNTLLPPEYERPGEDNPRVDGPQRLPRPPVKGKGRNAATGMNQVTAVSNAQPGSGLGGNYGAGQAVPAGQNTANYLAGLRSYGAGMRSAPNVGAVRNKSGYNERDRKVARVNGASLASGDEQSRVRLLGG